MPDLPLYTDAKKQDSTVLSLSRVASFWKKLGVLPRDAYDILMMAGTENLQKFRISFYQLENLKSAWNINENKKSLINSTTEDLQRAQEEIEEVRRILFREDSAIISNYYNECNNTLIEKGKVSSNSAKSYREHLLNQIVEDYGEGKFTHLDLWLKDVETTNVYTADHERVCKEFIQKHKTQWERDFGRVVDYALDEKTEFSHQYVEEPPLNVLPGVEQHQEMDFLGQPIFIPKNANNLSNAIEWNTFHEHYTEDASMRLLNHTIEGKKCYTLPHYDGGDCLWQVLGIPVQDVYELVIAYSSDLLDQYCEAQNRFDTLYPIVLPPLNEIKEKLEQKKEEEETQEQQKTRIERQQLAEEVDTAARAVVEVFDFFFPQNPSFDPIVRAQKLKELLAQHKSGNTEHKLKWIEGVKKYGGRPIDNRVEAGAFRPPHSIHFFQQAAEYLGVNIQLVRDDIQTIYLS